MNVDLRPGELIWQQECQIEAWEGLFENLEGKIQAWEWWFEANQSPKGNMLYVVSDTLT